MESGRLVLVCDDTEQIRRLIRMNLELEDYEVHEVADGQEALEWLQDESHRLPVVVTVDASMTPRDGWWAIEQIRLDQRLADLPVIMITASVQHHDRVQASDAGLDAFVAKPFDPELLLEVVARLAAEGRPNQIIGL